MALEPQTPAAPPPAPDQDPASVVPEGGAVNPAPLAPPTVVISPSPPTAPSGPVTMDRVGIDTGGNIWLMYPRVFVASAWTGGWQYAATVTSGGLPLEAGGTDIEGGGTATPAA